MAAKKKTQKTEPSGTVAARHARETERQATARATRNQLAAETKAERAATDKRLATKPTDTRKLS